MVIQEHGNLNNYVLLKGETKGVIEVRDFLTKELIYIKKRFKVPGAYVSKLLDPVSQAELAEVQGKRSNAKLKQIILYQPDDIIDLKDSGVLTFEYKFYWEDEKYLWKKRNIGFSKELECKLVHGDDPGIGVCMFKQESKNLGCLTIMYYNMERIPVRDRKGLEYLLVMTLLSFLDKWDDDNISKPKNEFILGEESNGDFVELLENRKKKKPDKKSEKLIIQLAEEEANMQEQLRNLKEQEKKDEEYARQLHEEELRSSNPNYNEKDENVITYPSTNATIPSPSSEQEEYYRKRPPPSPPSAVIPPKLPPRVPSYYSDNSNSLPPSLFPPSTLPPGVPSYYPNNSNTLPPSTLAPGFPSYYPVNSNSNPSLSPGVPSYYSDSSSSSLPPNSYPPPPSWNSSYPNTAYTYTTATENNYNPYVMPMPSIPSFSSQYPPNYYNNGMTSPPTGSTGPSGCGENYSMADSQSTNSYPNPASTNYPPVPGSIPYNNYPPQFGNPNDNIYSGYNTGNNGFNNGYNNGYGGGFNQ
ncbi:10860_t:CDS:2 [Funneliformis geosporum]|uniref:10860_t:CDS:1 n=1 Tax=Funneliformis geosporum TaxID=1117311 RepID=A0A9W4WVJ0_9GLOM|nr:10860_t:CDS:2 [Funneliformis geosporum]